MTPDQITLVRTTFAVLRPIAQDAAALFYARLFELDPTLRALFPTNLQRQGTLLMQMIGVAVANLDRADTLVPTVEALGRRHVDYGVQDRHYDVVGRALIDTLAQGLGSQFTPDVRDAWGAAYNLLATTMKAGAASDRENPQRERARAGEPVALLA
jgi:hemoglobin-like flavoprotein